MKKGIICILLALSIIISLAIGCSSHEPVYTTFEGVVSGYKSNEHFSIIYIGDESVRVEDTTINLAVGKCYRITTKDEYPDTSTYSAYIYRLEIID